MYAGNAALKARGTLSIAVPGELAGLHEAWKQHGKLPWKRVVKPAAQIARRGFKISPYLYIQMQRTNSGIFADKGLHDLFTSNGSLLQLGDTCYNKRLAHTLEVIARLGPQAFYNGSVGINLVKDVRKSGGMLTMKDLQKYQLKVKEPISADFTGLKILGMPLPSSSGPGIILVSFFLKSFLLYIVLLLYTEFQATDHYFCSM